MGNRKRFMENGELGKLLAWCKPIIGDEEFAVAAMKYALSLGVDTLVPPGNFEHFSFAVEHIDECLSNPLTPDDVEFLKRKLKQINRMYFL